MHAPIPLSTLPPLLSLYTALLIKLPSFGSKNLSYIIPSVDFPFNLTMKALDQRLLPKISLCNVFIHAKSSCERPSALLVPSQLVRRAVPATVSGNTWALLLTRRCTALLYIRGSAISGGTQHPTDICVQCWWQ